MKIRHTTELSDTIYSDAVAIRQDVFILEQGVPREIELDTHEKECLHFVLYTEKDESIATCRLLHVNSTNAKIQRMAVKKKFRGHSYGRLLIEEVEKIAKEKKYTIITLGAQVTAVGFYETLGYQKNGEPFIEANIEHSPMDKKL